MDSQQLRSSCSTLKDMLAPEFARPKQEVSLKQKSALQGFNCQHERKPIALKALRPGQAPCLLESCRNPQKLVSRSPGRGNHALRKDVCTCTASCPLNFSCLCHGLGRLCHPGLWKHDAVSWPLVRNWYGNSGVGGKGGAALFVLERKCPANHAYLITNFTESARANHREPQKSAFHDQSVGPTVREILGSSLS